ncbi:hypothetical protein PVL29_006148 [Vitis rotundifolia]|uniref:Uncharacterized protein n=1 Tax=Vitis rotundifolia TaxID=103349 RepID=A0AA39A495_VITRO|nr:hypothetical protein PVL29_006148 [Vitis rotundifolia]
METEDSAYTHTPTNSEYAVTCPNPSLNPKQYVNMNLAFIHGGGYASLSTVHFFFLQKNKSGPVGQGGQARTASLTYVSKSASLFQTLE